MQPHYYQSVPPAGPATASKVDSEWDGGSVNFGWDILGGLNPAVLAGNETIDQLRSDQTPDPVSYY